MTCRLRLPRIAACLAVAGLLCSCDPQATLDKIVPKEEAAIAKDLVDKLAAKDYSAVEEKLDPRLRTPETRRKLEEMARLLPAEKPSSIRAVGANILSTESTKTSNLTFEYQYGTGWILANAVLERHADTVTLKELHILPRTQSLEEENRFTLRAKSASHYLVFGLAIAIPLFVLYALVLCIRTRIPRRKWLWILFVMVGFFEVQFNWTTGAWGVQAFAAALFGAAFTKSGPVAPYIRTLAIPVGAIVFLARRRAFQARSAAPRDPRPSTAGSRVDVLALDLEGTLISNAVSQIPRPGLWGFLEFCRQAVPRLVLYTSVSEEKVREITARLVADGAVPPWFQEIDCIKWSGPKKDLAAIPDAPLERTVLIDDHEEYVVPEQRGQWLPIAWFAAPYPSDDTELDRVRRVLEEEWGCHADR
jgi:hypothetical protein